MSRRRWRTSWLRIFSQALFLVLFLVLFRKTEYTGSDEIAWAVNFVFRADPLLAATAMLAARTFIGLFIPAVILTVLTVVAGRFFCGWICPLGTCLDVFHRVAPGIKPRPSTGLRGLKYGLLAFLLASALFGLPGAGYFDPFSILVRGMTFSLDPAFYVAVRAPFTWLFHNGPAWVTAVSEPVYGVLRDYVLPHQRNVFLGAPVALAMLGLIFLAELIERRFWCRNLCPLGALLALLSRWSLPFRRKDGGCTGCEACSRICRMGAISEGRRVRAGRCVLCLDCVDACPVSIWPFAPIEEQSLERQVALSRRAFLGSMAAGATLPVLLDVGITRRTWGLYLIRPPGALPEDEFVGRCVRCGECMKVCIGNALQPTSLEAGLGGVFTPKVVPRIGYCEYNCTLCGQICPSGAIRRLSVKEKQETVIGRAIFDKDRCLPYVKGISCVVCEEHCPVADKAIKLREAYVVNEAGLRVKVKQPYVVSRLCIGCGICETKCPLAGCSAVRVTREGESRDPESFVLPSSGYGGSGGYGD